MRSGRFMARFTHTGERGRRAGVGGKDEASAREDTFWSLRVHMALSQDAPIVLTHLPYTQVRKRSLQPPPVEAIK